MQVRSRVSVALAMAIAATVLAPPASAQGSALDARVSRLERMLNERSISDLVLQIQQLQQEVQELRGQVETQQYLLRQNGITGSGASGADGSSVAGFGGNRLDSGGFGQSAGGSGERVRDALPGLDADPFAPARERTGNESEPTQQGRETGAASRSSGLSSGLLGLPTPETSSGGERDLYREAFDLLKARDYPAARDAFGEMLTRFPQGQFADNGRYWLGEIGYVTQDYPAAQAQFNRLVTDYPLSPKVPAAMLKLGYVYYEQDELADARRTLEQVVERFPDSTEAQLAKGRLERMQREGG